jgi:hypothetical protein
VIRKDYTVTLDIVTENGTSTAQSFKRIKYKLNFHQLCLMVLF